MLAAGFRGAQKPKQRKENTMNFAARIAVRQNKLTGRTVAGFASSLPRLGTEWRDVANFGRWFGGQMGYRPFKAAMAQARDLAEYYSDLASGK